MTTPRVVVVGGGITGLSRGVSRCATKRRRRGGAARSLTVLEAERHAGGHAQTVAAGRLPGRGRAQRLPEPRAGDAGADRGARPDARLVEARPEASRRFIVRDGRLCQVPDSPAALRHLAGAVVAGQAAAAGEPFAAAAPGHRRDGARVRRAPASAREAAEMLVDAAVSGISAGDSRRLSVRAQFPMMVEMERDHGSLFRAMFARREVRQRARRGSSASTRAWACSPRPGGAARPAHRDRTPRSRAVDARGRRLARAARRAARSLEADHVVLAVPARVDGAPMVESCSTPRWPASSSAVDYAGLAVVALGYRAADVPRPLDGYGYLVTRPREPGHAGRGVGVVAVPGPRAGRHGAAARHARRLPSPDLVGRAQTTSAAEHRPRRSWRRCSA